MLKSLKNKLKAAKREAEQLPRDMKDIQTDYRTTLAKAGQAQFQAYMSKRALDAINKDLEVLNAEANARTQLDNTKKQEEPKEETKAV